MDAVRWILIALFACLGLGLLSAAQGARGRILAASLAGATCYLGGAVGAAMQKSLWPLAVGFGAAWALRLFRFDPGWSSDGVLLDVPDFGRVRMHVVPQMHLTGMLLAQGYDGTTTEEIVEEYWRLKQPGATIDSRAGVQCIEVLESLGLAELSGRRELTDQWSATPNAAPRRCGP